MKYLLFCYLLIYYLFILGCTSKPAKTILANENQTDIEQIVEDVDLDEKIGQMLMVGIPRTHEEYNDITKYKIGGIIIGGPYFKQFLKPGILKNKVSELQSYSAKELKLFIAIDEEGGAGSRLNDQNQFSNFPTALEIVKLPIEKVKINNSAIAQLCLENQINLNLAPVVDLATNPRNEIIYKHGRSYSTHADEVIKYAKLFIEEHHQKNIMTTLKHFPGHGNTQGDSHLSFVDMSLSWNKAELEPYKSLIHNDLVDLIMIGHLFHNKLDPRYPASLSETIVTGLLRNKLNYNGVVISDDLQMAAITNRYLPEQIIELAVMSGTDILLFANWISYYPIEYIHTSFKNLVLSGKIPMARINDSYNRILQLKKKFGLTQANSTTLSVREARN
jgi:beta-N-acetylhexosaminidase